MFHILVLLVSWLTWGTVDLINTNAYSVSLSATMIEMTFEEYAHNQGVDDITLTNLFVNADFIVLNNQTLKEVFEDNNLINNYDFVIDDNNDNLADYYVNYGGTPLYDNGQKLTGLGTGVYLGLGQGLNTVINNVYYFRLEYRTNNITDKLFQVTSNSPSQIFYQDTIVLNGFISLINIPLTNKTDINVLYIDENDNILNTEYVVFEKLFYYNLTDLGISNLSQTELDTLYSYYQAVKNDVSLGISKIDVIDDVSYYTNDLIILELGTSSIYTKSQLDDLIAYYGYFDDEQTFLNINHIDFDAIYTEFFGSAPTVFLDNYDSTVYIDLTTTYDDIDINDIGIMLIFLLGYLTVIHIVKEYL